MLPASDVVRPYGVGFIASVALCCVAPVHAELGGDAASIARDQTRLQGQRRMVSVQAPAGHRAQALSAGTAPSTALTAHEITQADGSVIREYLTPDGVVYAVAWQTHFRPDLGALFGLHAGSYIAAAKAAMKAPGIKRNVALQSGDLIVHATSHFNIFSGQAYVPSLLPVGVNVNALR